MATTQSAAKRFEVTDSNFQKHISIFSGEDLLASVYLGTSPSFRKVHARQTDDSDIYAIEFSNYEAGTSASSWLDKELLQTSGTIKELERIGAYTLILDNGNWTTEADLLLDESKVRSYVDRFESLTVFNISDHELTDATTNTQFRIEDADGEFLLTIYHFDVANEWVAVSDRHSSQYGVASYIGSELIKNLEDLAPDAEIEADTDEASADDSEEILLEVD